MTRDGNGQPHAPGDEDCVLAALASALMESGVDLNDEDKVAEVVSAVVAGAFPQCSQAVLSTLKSLAPPMLRRWRRRRQGFKRRLRRLWGRPIDLLETLLIASHEVGERLNRQYGRDAHEQQDEVFEVLARLHARACQVGFEVLTLLKAGFAAGAHARWRTLHETAVVAYFVKEHGNTVAERYMAHDAVESYKAAMRYQEDCDALGYPPLTEEELRTVNAAFDAACARFGPDFRNEYGWASDALGKSKPTFADIEKCTGLSHLRTQYKLASHGVHANPKGVTFNLGLMPSGNNVLLAGPSNAGLADPAQGTAISLFQVTTAFQNTRPSFTQLILLGAMNQLVGEVCQSFVEVHRQLERDGGEGGQD